MTATYPDAPGFKVGGPSRDAALSEVSRASTLRDQVAGLLDKEELTADDCAEALNASVLSVRPRLSELVKQGRIEDAGVRRRNRSGKFATVWRLAVRKSQPELFVL